MLNPLQAMMQLRQMQNPMGAMTQMFQGNPMMSRAMQMANGKNEEQLKQTVKNLGQQAGMSEEQLMGLANQFGLKF